MPTHEKINYLELPAKDMQKTQVFFEQAFGWEFQAYSDQYMAFRYAGMAGGFYLSGLQAATSNGSALIVIYSDNLLATQEKIKRLGGKIIKPIFRFPGGRRFHFTEPSGNELAVWAHAQEIDSP